ncbi:hypothetical protein Rrhod_4026 [Rhodococcus rhodnii LMG 5362]|uniref:Uncharacterized protein n=1 Tax=Rhodococcus rhodnii LMG 5362 TaxID=1273125 RepID=R7WHS7_9NOCA|nr:hypothetical protein Rrhod_4026 [Rhodococcus rhodnii LMG 5362]
MVIGLEPDADLLSRHAECPFLAALCSPARSSRPTSSAAVTPRAEARETRTERTPSATEAHSCAWTRSAAAVHLSWFSGPRGRACRRAASPPACIPRDTRTTDRTGCARDGRGVLLRLSCCSVEFRRTRLASAAGGARAERVIHLATSAPVGPWPQSSHVPIEGNLNSMQHRPERFQLAPLGPGDPAVRRLGDTTASFEGSERAGEMRRRERSVIDVTRTYR